MIVLKFIFGLMIPVITIGLMIVTASIIQKKKQLLKTETDKEKKTDKWWWNFFKPHFCLPIAWGLLHVIFALLCPNAFYYTFTNLLGIVIVIEISIFVLNTIVNKNVDFEKRSARKALLYTYVIIFIITIGIIPSKVLYGETYAKWNRWLYAKMTASQAELLGEKTNQASENHLIKKRMVALEKLNNEAKKRTLTPNELKEVGSLVAEIKKIPVKKEDPLTPPPPPIPRTLSGIFQIPPGATINRDTNGKQIEYLKGERVILEVFVGPYRDLIFMNKNIPHIKINKKRTFIRGVGPRSIINEVQLMNIGKEKIFVEVEVRQLRRT